MSIEFVLWLLLYIVVGLGQMRNHGRLVDLREAYEDLLDRPHDPENHFFREQDLTMLQRVILVSMWFPYFFVLGLIVICEIIKREKILQSL